VIKFLGVFTLLVMLVSTVSAFAVSSMYWEENPMEVYPSQTTEGILVLQNLGGESDLVVEGIITEGEEFVNFVGGEKTFVVPKGEKLNIFYIVNIPEEANIGDVKEIVFSFKTVLSGESGEFLGFSGGVERVIPLSIIAEPKLARTGLSWWSWLLILIAVIAVVTTILIITKSRKKIKKK